MACAASWCGFSLDDWPTVDANLAILRLLKATKQKITMFQNCRCHFFGSISLYFTSLPPGVVDCTYVSFLCFYLPPSSSLIYYEYSPSWGQVQGVAAVVLPLERTVVTLRKAVMGSESPESSVDRSQNRVLVGNNLKLCFHFGALVQLHRLFTSCCLDHVVG